MKKLILWIALSMGIAYPAFSIANVVDIPIESNVIEVPGEYREDTANEILSTNIDGIKASYEVGFYNNIPSYGSIYDIKLNFDSEFKGKLNIYKPINYSSENNEIYKSFDINGKSAIFTIKGANDLSFEIENDKGISKKLEDINTKGNYNTLQVKELKNCDSIYLCTDNLDYSRFSIMNMQTIIVEKNISEEESELLLQFAYKGGNLKLSQEVYNNHFKDIVKPGLSYYGFGSIDSPDNNNSVVLEEDNYYDKPYYNTHSLEENTVRNLLIDETIESKYMPYGLILIFVCIYFIIIIPLNFWLKKKKGNKLFFVYSIPAVSIGFLAILILLNIMIKGVNSVENQLEINFIKDGKAYQQVYKLTFSPNGGNFQEYIAPEDVMFNMEEYNYYSRSSSKNWDIEDNKLKIMFENVKSSELIEFHYGKVIEEGELNTNITYENTYDNIKDFNDDYLEKPNSDYYRYNYSNIFNEYSDNQDIKEIKVSRNIDQDYANKYSLGGEASYKLRIDIYY